jgi:hypothetical protein
MDMRFGTGNSRSLYTMSSLMTVLRELSEYKLHLVGVQKVRWDANGTNPAGEYMFFYEQGNGSHRLDTGSIDLIEIGWDSTDRIALAQDRDKWRALVNVVLNLCVP